MCGSPLLTISRNQVTIMNKTCSTGRDGLANSAGEIATIALYGEFGPPILTAARSFREAGLEIVVLGIGLVSFICVVECRESFSN